MDICTLKTKIKELLSILPLSFFIVSAASGNDDSVTYDRVHLSATATSQVTSDTLVATLYYQREGSNLAGLANEVNEKISAAVQTSKKVSNIEIQTPEYRSNPIYEKQRLIGWRVRQSIRLEGRDINQLSKLIGELQNTLAVESISYTISPGKLQDTEEKLITQAIEAFEKRALLITHQFGRNNYRLVDVSVNTAGPPIQPLRTGAAVKPMAAVPPTIEASKRDIRVNIGGTIELQTQ
jgi:predicted secreted protein